MGLYKGIILRLKVTAVLLSIAVTSFAQRDSILFEENHVIDTTAIGELRINVDNLNFFKNNEYESEIVKGYTLPGFWVKPSVSYQPLKNLKVDVGAYMIHYWGATKYPNFNYSDMPEWHGDQYQKGFHVLPFFRVQIDPTKRLSLILGTLYGHNNHNLIAPLYNYEMGLSGDPETGFQVIWDAPRLKLDSWINWESFIYRNDTHQESFSFGTSLRLLANSSEAPMHVYFPVQMIFQHRGGEINTEAEERQVKTWMNAAAGVGLTFNTRNTIVPWINLEACGVSYKQVAGDMLPFDKGHGFLGTASMRLWKFDISGEYWWCKDFISILGNPLYGAMGIEDKSYLLDKPKMINAHLGYSQYLGNGFAWGIHGDVFNNIKENAVSWALGVYMRINFNFLLKKF